MNMIERVARAIRIHQRGSDNGWKMRENMELAKVAIAAMREPTDEMAEIGDSMIEVDSASITTWQAMIDAALIEEKK